MVEVLRRRSASAQVLDPKERKKLCMDFNGKTVIIAVVTLQAFTPGKIVLPRKNFPR